MTPLNGGPAPESQGQVDVDANLESLIADSGGDTTHAYTVTQDGTPVGTLDMKELVRALVPRLASEGGIRDNVTS